MEHWVNCVAMDLMQQVGAIPEPHIVRIANGKAMEHWGNSDDLAIMQQQGVIPES